MIMEIADESPRAYVPFHLAVKSSQPRDFSDIGCKDKAKKCNLQIFC